MKLLLISLLLLVGNSCSERTVEEGISPEIESTIGADGNTSQEGQNPNQIVLTAFVIETFDNKTDICGQQKQNVVFVKIDSIISHGQAIVNLPHKNQERLVHFLTMEDSPEINQKLELTAQESLCSDVSKTYLTVLSHKISE